MALGCKEVVMTLGGEGVLHYTKADGMLVLDRIGGVKVRAAALSWSCMVSPCHCPPQARKTTCCLSLRFCVCLFTLLSPRSAFSS